MTILCRKCLSTMASVCVVKGGDASCWSKLELAEHIGRSYLHPHHHPPHHQAISYLINFCSYRIVGNFWGRKRSQICEKYDFHGENFADCSLLLHQRMPLPNFAEKTFADSNKTAKFSPSKVSRTMQCFWYSSFICSKWSVTELPLRGWGSHAWMNI